MPDTGGPARYGEAWARIYDETYPDPPPHCVDTVAELAGGDRVLELGIGSGRIALPLCRRGIDVVGIDASPAMLERLRAKPGGADIPVTTGDFTDTRVDGTFGVVLLAFNTLFALASQDAQVGCFANAARHLAPGGAFVLECFVPDLGRFDRGQRVSAAAVGDDRVVLEVSRHDPATQTVRSQHVRLTAGGMQLFPVEVRYAWPAELDLMAGLAGLRLRERWADWSRRPFTADATAHVSLYGA